MGGGVGGAGGVGRWRRMARRSRTVLTRDRATVVQSGRVAALSLRLGRDMVVARWKEGWMGVRYRRRWCGVQALGGVSVGAGCV